LSLNRKGVEMISNNKTRSVIPLIFSSLFFMGMNS
jgi:hypothetical protein